MPVPFRDSRFAKKRREVGDPIAYSPGKPRFLAPPENDWHDPSLAMELELVLPGITREARTAGRLVFHSVGDTGGIKGTETQTAIAEAMEGQLNAAADGERPAFMYHLGDVIYYNGQSENYVTQFYEPYQYYDAPIFAIPGNHDGDTKVLPHDQPDTEPSLFGFFQNFCNRTGANGFKHRSPLNQPYCWWTLKAPFVWIIGLYSNVDGLLDPTTTRTQWSWLVEQLRAAPADKWVIVAVHHPCYSLDSAHGGYKDILDALDAAVASAERLPDAVLSGHVHDYQRFIRAQEGRQTPYIIAGAGGYADDAKALHQMQKGLDLKHLPFQTTRQDVKLAALDVKNPGFLRLSVSPQTLDIEYFPVPFGKNEAAAKPADHVTVKATSPKTA